MDVADKLDTIDVLHKELVSLNVNPDSFAAGIPNPQTGVPMLLGIITDKMVGLPFSARAIVKARDGKS